ncbi:hypothetical protein ACS0TY_023679 [Phlomoides rotata]
MFICGSRSFGHQDKNGSRMSSKRSKSFSNSNTKKNPYADGGVDKFLALVADLEEKKQRIYDEMGPEDISFIRFVYSDDSEQVKPIVVRARKNKKKLLVPPPAAEKSINVEEEEEKLLQVRRDGSFRLKTLGYPAYYVVGVVLVLILLFLAIYGRSLTILCTSIAWYLLPQFVVMRDFNFNIRNLGVRR